MDERYKDNNVLYPDLLNPWIIETYQNPGPYSINVKIVNRFTGEIRGITLDVDNINQIIEQQEQEKRNDNKPK